MLTAGHRSAGTNRILIRTKCENCGIYIYIYIYIERERERERERVLL
jgi:hypothetical protein